MPIRESECFLRCSTVVIGRSTHNQRCVSRLPSLFYQIFQYLEMHNMLDADNDVHIWCLHLIYVPMINQHLETLKASWVHHLLRTEGNKSPMQLWIGGLHGTQFGQAILKGRSRVKRHFLLKVVLNIPKHCAIYISLI